MSGGLSLILLEPLVISLDPQVLATGIGDRLDLDFGGSDRAADSSFGVTSGCAVSSTSEDSLEL